MDHLNPLERITQDRVIQLFRQELGLNTWVVCMISAIKILSLMCCNLSISRGIQWIGLSS